MPRRGAFTRDFPAIEPEPVVLAGTTGARVVHATGTRKSTVSTSRLDPSRYQSSRLAGELADEWVEYMAAAELSPGTVRAYQQAIDLLCVSVDAELGRDAPNASLAVDQPDLVRAAAAWERTLPSGFPLCFDSSGALGGGDPAADPQT
ncbi:hypothetical protein AB0K05_38170 [Nonomuraea sp. NPDC049486]|uniref:hypothetical protein n=1 Tax=Nonomuraea sp. NPDC049486 TaxID=3155773 RepID=UPI0034178BAE